MISLKRLREAVQSLAGRNVATRPEVPAYTRSQIEGIGRTGLAKSLPQRPTNPLQVLDTSDPNFGERYFIPGMDAPGSHPIRPS